MSPIRINMVVNADEHPDLYELLATRMPKARASVLRQHAAFGLWAKSREAGIVGGTQALGVIAPPPHPAKPAAPPVAAAPVSDAPQSSQHEGQGDGHPVLDTSVLAGVDLGGLD